MNGKSPESGSGPTAPRRHYNRPGLSTLAYRSSTYITTLRRMLARLATQTVPPGTDSGKRPLQGLSPKAADDPAIALLDGWAVVQDILTFYQERIANEGYLHTATERRSVHALTRSIGYELGPGVAASTQLAFTVETAPGAPKKVKVPAGTQVLSIPGQDEMPQTFETLKAIEARADWNDLTLAILSFVDPAPVVSGQTELRLQGLLRAIKPGNGLLLVGQKRKNHYGSERWDFRPLKSVELLPNEENTLVTWEKGLGYLRARREVLPADYPDVFIFQDKARMFGWNAPKWRTLPDTIRRPVIQEQFDLDWVPNEVTCLAVSPDGSRLASGCTDGYIKVWNTRTGGRRRTLREHTLPVTGLAYIHGGSYLLSVSRDKTLKVWDTSSWEVSQDQLIAGGALACLAVLEDGAPAGEPGGSVLVVVGDDRGNLRLYTLNPATQILRLVADTAVENAVMTAVAVSPDRNWIAAGTKTGKVLLWRADTLTLVTTPAKKHRKEVSGLAFAKVNGNLQLYSAGLDHTIRIWSIIPDDEHPSYRVLTTIDGDETVSRDLEGFTSLALRLQGNDPPLILTGSNDHLVRLWKYVTLETKEKVWRPIRYYQGHQEPVTALAFMPGAEYLYSGSRDSSITQWETGDHAESNGKTGRLKRTLAGHPITDRYKHWPGLAITLDRNWIELEGKIPNLEVGQWIVVEKPNYCELYRITQVTSHQREDFCFSMVVTRLELDVSEHLSWFHPRNAVVRILGTQVQQAGETRQVVSRIEGKTVKLDQLAVGLERGQTIVISGRRHRLQINAAGLVFMPDAAGKTEVLFSGEIAEILTHPVVVETGVQKWRLKTPRGVVGTLTTADEYVKRLDADPGDDPVSEAAVITLASHEVRTTLTLKTAVTNLFDPATVTINANVVEATHGETVMEIMGSGDANRANQIFRLRKPPLTYIPAVAAAGRQSTLRVYVDDVRWEEAAALYGVEAAARKYMVRLNNRGQAAVIFGDGLQGARLPSGAENIKASYRSGSGPDGEVASGSLSLLPRRPLGIKAVTNPVPATGAAAQESRDSAREQAPRSVLTLGRIVSRQDFEDYTRTYPGIGKAQAVSFGFGEKRLLHITIATESGEAVGEETSLYTNLIGSINRYRGSQVELRVGSYIKRVFRIVAQILIDPDYIWERVEADIRQALLATFSFARREFGQGVAEAEVISAIARVAGVISVDLDELTYPDGTSPGQGNSDEDFRLPAAGAHLEGHEVVAGELLLIDPTAIILIDSTAKEPEQQDTPGA